MAWRIDISGDNLRVTLDLRKRGKNEVILPANIFEELRQMNIPVTDSVRQSVNAALSVEIQSPSLTILQGQPAEPGRNAFFQWSDKLDPEKIHAGVNNQLDTAQESFYEQSHLILVNRNDILGVYHMATPGKSGLDVFGRVVPPVPGQELTLEAGENVQMDPDGRTFIALCDGEPKLENGTLWVDPILHIKHDIDFSTGNIRFSGSVNVKGDIKDLFTVQTGGDLEVGGTIEAAVVECGGSLKVTRGILGKEKGSIKVKSDLTARYLSNVQIWADGNITAESEIVNCDLNCRGNILLQRGAIHGGQVTATGSIDTPALGSHNGVRTTIRAGVDPYLDRQIKQMRQEKECHEKVIADLMPRAKDMLYALQGKPNDKLKKMADDIRLSRNALETIARDMAAMEEELEKNQTQHIIVHKVIYPDTLLYIGKFHLLVTDELHGPMIISAPDSRDPAAAPQFRSYTEESLKPA